MNVGSKSNKEDAMKKVAEHETIIEEQKPLSRSMLWRMQRDFYEEQGKDAWENKIPYFLTSNAFIAKAYAHVILGFLQDCARNALDRDQPIYIVELGAGSGRLSFLLIKKLLSLTLQSPQPIAAFRYVMTDFTQKNIDSWRSHPALQPFINDSLLDFALFDAENDNRFLLQESGIALAPETIGNPVIAVANYLFDSLIQDVFRVRSGNLEEGLATLYTNAPTLPDPQKTVKLEQIKVRYDFKPVPRGYYQDPEFDQILDNYRDRLCDGAVCFPVGALRCIRSLLHLSNNRLFLLSADKGHAREQDLIGEMPPLPVMHGSFSMMVNYHAIGQYFQNVRHGRCLHMTTSSGGFCISGFVSDQAPPTCPATKFAFTEHIENFGPYDFYNLYLAVQVERKKMPLLTILNMIRMSEYDTAVFCRFSNAIIDAIDTISYEHEIELFQVLERVWDNWYFMQESLIDADRIATIYYNRHRFSKSLSIITGSMKYSGERAVSLSNIGLCLYKMNMIHQALSYLNRALEIDKNHEFSRFWRIRLEDQLKLLGPYAPEKPATSAGLSDLPILPNLSDLPQLPNELMTPPKQAFLQGP